MKNWSDIQNEILNLITIYCGRDCKKVKWMFVNKHWFTFYLSQVYSTVQTSLGNETIINKILDFPFDIGKYVKYIKLYNIQQPQNLNKIDVSNNLLGLIMKQTPNVQKVRLFRDSNDTYLENIYQSEIIPIYSYQSETNPYYIYLDWLYLSVALINMNSWKLQFLPTLGEDSLISAAYYYTCAYYSRYSLKSLELSVGMLNLKDVKILIEFTALEILEVHKNLINGLTTLESLLQFTPKLQELTVRFSSNRVCQSMKKRYYETDPSIKKLWLYNFTPQCNDELLILVKKFSTLQNLYIFGEKDKKWLSNINDPLVIKKFFNRINSISKYEIMIPGDKQEVAFSESWLKSISSPKQDIHLVLSYNEKAHQDHLTLESNAVATFYGGLTQPTPALKYTIRSQTYQEMTDTLSVLDDRCFLCLRITGVRKNLSTILAKVTAEKGYYLKRVDIFNCILDSYKTRINTSSNSQSIKHIAFQNCQIYLLPLKSFISEFDSLDCIEFDNCTSNRSTSRDSMDMGNTNIKSVQMKRFQKFFLGSACSDTVQTVISISIYFVTENLTRYYSIIDGVVINSTKRTFDLFCNTYNTNEVMVLNIKVKLMQELSLKITNNSKPFILSFGLQEPSLA